MNKKREKNNCDFLCSPMKFENKELHL